MGVVGSVRSRQPNIELFANAGVIVTPAGLCECGERFRVDIGGRTRDHFLSCPRVFASIRAAQKSVDHGG